MEPENGGWSGRNRVEFVGDRWGGSALVGFWSSESISRAAGVSGVGGGASGGGGKADEGGDGPRAG